MTLRASLLILFLGASAGWSAELRTLKKESFKGDLVSVTEKEVVFASGGTNKTIPALEVMEIELAPEPKLAADVKYADVEIVDGSMLRCSSVLIKGKEVEMTLLGAKAPVKMPLALVQNILYAGNDARLRKIWTDKVADKRTKDGLGILNGEVLNVVEVVLGDGDADGKTIEFTVPGTTMVRKRDVSKLTGLMFFRETDALAPPVAFRLIDGSGSVVLAASATSTPTSLSVTTPAGLKMVIPTNRLAKLDFSKGKVTYLSDLDPRETYSSTEDLVQKYQRDKNLEGTGPLRIKGEVYAKGLAIHATTTLEYELKGDYRHFLAAVGIDDAVGGIDGPTILLIEGINDREVKELLKLTVSRRDKERVRAVNLNIKDYAKLRITVSSGELLDLGKHLDLGDARVSK
jgi:hypothetical protein